MQKKLFVAALGTLVALPALADDAAAPASPNTFTSNVSLVTDYLYRGISQTGQKPAIQGGFDYSHSSGFYAGVWGSSISWITDGATATSANVEIDTYFGFRNSFADDWSYDIGFLRYNYPGDYVPGATKADTNEIYGQLGWKWFTAKYSYSLGDTFGVADAQGSGYLNLSASYPIPDTGVTLSAHYGHQTYDGTPADALRTAGLDPNYSDYSLGISKDLGSGYSVGLTFSDTDVNKGGFYTSLQGKDLGRSTAVLSLGRTF